jgi:hypothetical protein
MPTTCLRLTGPRPLIVMSMPSCSIVNSFDMAFSSVQPPFSLDPTPGVTSVSPQGDAHVTLNRTNDRTGRGRDIRWSMIDELKPWRATPTEVFPFRFSRPDVSSPACKSGVMPRRKRNTRTSPPTTARPDPKSDPGGWQRFGEAPPLRDQRRAPCRRSSGIAAPVRLGQPRRARRCPVVVMYAAVVFRL